MYAHVYMPRRGARRTYISPISPLYLPYISPISPLYLPYISQARREEDLRRQLERHDDDLVRVRVRLRVRVRVRVRDRVSYSQP